MSDPLSVLSAVCGLVAVSAHLGRLSKGLYDSAKVAPASMLQIQQEMQNIHIIFVQVEMFVRGGTGNKRPTKKGLTMLSLHHLMTILTGCVLVLSNIEKKLSEVAGLVDPATQKPARLQLTWDRIKWALWTEAEVALILQDLERHKSSLVLMLSLIQCNSISEANESLERLGDLVEDISESNVETSVQLRVLISRQYDEPSISCPLTSEGDPSISVTPSSASESLSTASFAQNRSDDASIRTAATSFSIRSIQSRFSSVNFTEELFSSRAYKRLRYRERGVDAGAASLFSLDSAATKGDRWSMLSDISLGQLSISEISVLELPICLSDLYDPQPYELAMEAQAKEQPEPIQRRRSVIWASRGRIHKAIVTNNDFAVRTMITLGVDIEERDSFGLTPLSYAAVMGKLDTCMLLLDKGAAVNTPDSYGRTPLSYAVEIGLGLDICTLLLDKGAAVNTPDSYGRTPVSHAAEIGRLDICTLLLDKVAAVNTPDCDGRTPLSYAAEIGRLDICTLLLDKGASVNTSDSYGRTPLSHSAEIGRLDICTLLLDKGAAVNTPDSYGRTPLSHSAEIGRLDICTLLLDKGAAVNTPDSYGRTPLSHAAEIGRLDICTLLLDKDAAVNTPDCDGRTPLSYAAAMRNLNICTLLLDKGAAVDMPGPPGRTPLSYAAAMGNVEISRLLLDKGAAVDMPDSSGRTPLSYAAERGLDICTFLLDNGAAVNTPDSSGYSPYWYAKASKNDETCLFLSKRGGR